MVLLDEVRKRMIKSGNAKNDDRVFWRQKYEILHEKAIENAWHCMRL